MFPHPPHLPFPPHCTSTSNPCFFELEGCTFNATSQDSLKHISMATLERVPRSSDRMNRLWQHIVGQGRYVPISEWSMAFQSFYGVIQQLRNGRNSNLLTLFCRIYPVLPAPLGACLDTSLASRFELSNSPDLLIVASDLNPCAKAVEVPFPTYKNEQLSIQLAEQKVVCINPGRLAKGRGGGTFAIVAIAGCTRAHPRVADRCKVSICRI